MRPLKFCCVLGAALMILGWASLASADSVIVYSGIIDNLTGLGHGDVLEVLSLQVTGNGTTEAGSVRWGQTGTKKGIPVYGDIYNDIPGGDFGSDAKGQGVTRMVSDFAGLTRDNFGVVFNINEGDALKELRVKGFSLYFQDSIGGVLLGTATFKSVDGAGDIFANLGGGQGQGDYLFQAKFVSPDDDWIDTWLASESNRVGMYVRASEAMSEVSGGAESFSVGPITSSAPMVIVPLPSAAWGSIGLMGALVATRLVRNRRRMD